MIPLRTLAALTLLLIAKTDCPAAVIVTTNGEEIVCEIVGETDTYFVVDHDGYRRYVLKTQVRSLDRRSGEGYDLGAGPRRSVEISGGYRVWGRTQNRGFGTAGAVASFPVHENLSLQAGLHAGRGELTSSYEAADPMPGPFSWAGGLAGAEWQLREGRVRPFLHAGVGYFGLRHSVSDSGVYWMKQAISAVSGDTSFVYTEPMDRGLGIGFGGGVLVPVFSRFALTFRSSVLILHTGFTRQWLYPATSEREETALRSSHGLTLEMIHVTAGVRWVF